MEKNLRPNTQNPFYNIIENINFNLYNEYFIIIMIIILMNLHIIIIAMNFFNLNEMSFDQKSKQSAKKFLHNLTFHLITFAQKVIVFVLVWTVSYENLIPI